MNDPDFEVHPDQQADYDQEDNEVSISGNTLPGDDEHYESDLADRVDDMRRG